jgi:hypothetical protein
MFNVEDIVDMARALFWYCNDNHEGQFSDTYEILCQISDIYRPGALGRGVDFDGMSGYYYCGLSSGDTRP